ncbi:MAG: ADP-ribosylglycohydrolase family protein [Bacteroidales bacterium]|nr:ADP-ribosylglycohydrolase family protein [Bacteroidales bacterium]
MACLLSSGCNDCIIDKCFLEDRIEGAMAAKIIGVQTGAPYEFWHLSSVNEKDSILVPIDYEGALGQDDIYTQLSFIGTLDRYGLDAAPQQLARDFANAGFPLFHANLQARKNFMEGLRPPQTGAAENNLHADDIDFQIDADFIGLMCPGMPRLAQDYCERIGTIMNDGDGLYGGMFVAAMHSLAFFENDVLCLVEQSLKNIPRGSDYYKCIADVVGQYRRDPSNWRSAWNLLHDKWEPHICTPNHPFNIDAKMNGAYVAIALLFGSGDFSKTLEIAVRCGQDADCNASTAAAVWGTMHGYSAIPDEYKAALEELSSKKFDHTDYTWTEAADKIAQFAGENIRKAGGSVSDGTCRIPRQKPGFSGQCRQPFCNLRYAESFYAANSIWKYEGGWSPFTVYDTDSFCRCGTPGASASLEFEGSMIAVTGAWGPTCGMADIYLDGEKVKTVDCYWPEDCGYFIINREVLFHLMNLTPGRHTLKMVVSEESNPQSAGHDIIFTRADIYR